MDHADYRLDPALLPAGLPDVLADVATAADWPTRRAEILALLTREVYGIAPPPPTGLSCAITATEENAYGGKAVHTSYVLSFDTPDGRFAFPFHLLVPRGERPPVFLHIAFRPDLPDRYCPVEEILDNGFALASFCYHDVATDADDGFVSGLAGRFDMARRRADEWGKIALWAWAASRVMDALEQNPAVDAKRVAVIGHSRLGKTALWCAANDPRFAMVYTNESGCAGTALTRGKRGEHIHHIMDAFGYWFCENFRQHADNEEEMPFDQHWLLALIAPRLLCHGGARQDIWSDPYAEFLGCLAVDPVYRLLGTSGLDGPSDGYPCGPVAKAWHEGRVGYHLREGEHFLSRTDWGQAMAFWRKHM